MIQGKKPLLYVTEIFGKSLFAIIRIGICKCFTSLSYNINWEETPLISKAEQRLLNPPPDGAIEAARKFGIDLTLIIERLRLTPAQRVEAMQQAMIDLAQIRGLARKKNK